MEGKGLKKFLVGTSVIFMVFLLMAMNVLELYVPSLQSVTIGAKENKMLSSTYSGDVEFYIGLNAYSTNSVYTCKKGEHKKLLCTFWIEVDDFFEKNINFYTSNVNSVELSNATVNSHSTSGHKTSGECSISFDAVNVGKSVITVKYMDTAIGWITINVEEEKVDTDNITVEFEASSYDVNLDKIKEIKYTINGKHGILNATPLDKYGYGNRDGEIEILSNSIYNSTDGTVKIKGKKTGPLVLAITDSSGKVYAQTNINVTNTALTNGDDITPIDKDEDVEKNNPDVPKDYPKPIIEFWDEIDLAIPKGETREFVIKNMIDVDSVWCEECTSNIDAYFEDRGSGDNYQKVLVVKALDYGPLTLKVYCSNEGKKTTYTYTSAVIDNQWPTIKGDKTPIVMEEGETVIKYFKPYDYDYADWHIDEAYNNNKINLFDVHFLDAQKQRVYADSGKVEYIEIKARDGSATGGNNGEYKFTGEAKRNNSDHMNWVEWNLTVLPKELTCTISGSVENGYTNSEYTNVVVSFNKPVASFEKENVSVSNAQAEVVSVNSIGNNMYLVKIKNPEYAKDMTVSVKAGECSATDDNNLKNKVSNSFKYSVDRIAPKIENVVVTKGETKTTIQFDVTEESVDGFASASCDLSQGINFLAYINNKVTMGGGNTFKKVSSTKNKQTYVAEIPKLNETDKLYFRIVSSETPSTAIDNAGNTFEEYTYLDEKMVEETNETVNLEVLKRFKEKTFMISKSAFGICFKYDSSKITDVNATVSDENVASVSNIKLGDKLTSADPDDAVMKMGTVYLQGLNPGTLTLTITGTDANNGTYTDTATVTFIDKKAIDEIKPWISISDVSYSRTEEWKKKHSILINAAKDDTSTSENIKLEYYWEKQGETTTPNWIVGEYGKVIELSGVNGKYNFHCRVTDEAGNSKEYTVENFYFDNQVSDAEMSSLQAVQNNGQVKFVRSGCMIITTKEDKDLEFEYTENNGQPYYEVTYITDGTEGNGINLSLLSGAGDAENESCHSVSYARLYELSDNNTKGKYVKDITTTGTLITKGNWFVEVKTRDNAGNVRTENYILKDGTPEKPDEPETPEEPKDEEAPVITVTGNDTEEEKEKVELTITVTDSGSGVDTVKVNDKVAELKDGSVKCEILKNGSYVIIATDKAGNIATKTVVVNNIKEKTTEPEADTTKPQVAEEDITTSGTKAWKKENWVKIAKATDDRTEGSNIKLEYYWEKQGEEETAHWTVSEFGKEIRLSGVTGKYNFHYRVTDEAGNSESYAINDFYFDNEAPVITVTGNESQEEKEEVELTITITDSKSGVDTLKINNKVAELQDGSVKCTIVENGTYVITATDKAGNTATENVVVNNIKAKTTEENKPGETTDPTGKEDDKPGESTDPTGKEEDKPGETTDQTGKEEDKPGETTDPADKENKTGTEDKKDETKTDTTKQTTGTTNSAKASEETKEAPSTLPKTGLVSFFVIGLGIALIIGAVAVLQYTKNKM